MLTDPPSVTGHGDQTLSETAGTPTAEALFALRVSAEVARQLHEAGRELRFAIVPSPRCVDVLLCDLNGFVLSRLSPSRALEIATGEPGSRRHLEAAQPGVAGAVAGCGHADHAGDLPSAGA